MTEPVTRWKSKKLYCPLATTMNFTKHTYTVHFFKLSLGSLSILLASSVEIGNPPVILVILGLLKHFINADSVEESLFESGSHDLLVQHCLLFPCRLWRNQAAQSVDLHNMQCNKMVFLFPTIWASLFFTFSMK